MRLVVQLTQYIAKQNHTAPVAEATPPCKTGVWFAMQTVPHFSVSKRVHGRVFTLNATVIYMYYQG